jgi:hypothetical protein
MATPLGPTLWRSWPKHRLPRISSRSLPFEAKLRIELASEPIIGQPSSGFEVVGRQTKLELRSSCASDRLYPSIR